jgi:hypothetical protein
MDRRPLDALDALLRKPLHGAAPRERRDVLRTFRFKESEDRAYQDGAVAEGAEFSEYVRECVAIGHSMKVAQRIVSKAGA